MTFPFHLPKEAGQTRRFDATSLSADVFQPYSVPVGAVALLILCVGGGGGGGNGFTRAAGSAGGGGGGGGSGGISRLWIPTAVIPSTLYVQGGPGGAANTVGGRSGVSVDGGAYHVSKTLLIANGGGAGGNGAVGAAGAAGSAGGIATSGAYGALGVFIGIAGQAGGAGGAHTGANGSGATWGGSNIFTSGGGGGGGIATTTDFNGGNIIGQGLVPSMSGGTVANGYDGTNGFESWMPPSFTGGAGGATRNDGAAGNGGIAARGCGGGGGGAGQTGGAGGRGGDGFVMITAIF